MNTCPKLIFLFLLLLLLNFPSKALAATGINKQINFQGKVVNANGTNVTNGNYDFVFSIYTVATAGTAIWTETRTTVNQVAVTDGIFRVSLGSITALPGSIDFNTDNIYLGINFNSDGEMTPRVQFTAVPQAFNALKVAGLTVTDTTGTFTLAAAKTLTVNNTLTFAGTDATTLTFQGTDTYVGRATTDTLTNKTIGSTGLTFSGATTDITTATGEDLTLVANGAGVLKLGDFTTANGVLYISATDGTTAETAASTGAQCLQTTGAGLAPVWGACAAGGGITTVRESDVSPSVGSLTTLEFGPATTSEDEFVVTDQTGGVARVVLGSKVVKTDATQTLSNKTFSSDINFLDANPGTAYTVAGSDSTAVTVAGGDLTVRAGAGLTTGGGGNLIVAGGTSPSGTAGYLALQTAGTERFRVAADGTFLFEKGAQDVILSVTAPATSTRTYTIPDFGANDSFVGLAATQALTGKTYNGLTVNTTTGTLALTNAKTLTVSDSTTLGTNAITLAGGEVITFSATNALSLLTTGSTSVTLPTSGTLVNSAVTTLSSLTTVGSLVSGTVIGSQTFTTNNIVDSGALTIKSGGTSALTLDTSGAAAINLANTNATSIALGNATTNPTLTLTGSGLTTLGGGLTFSGTTARTITGPNTGAAGALVLTTTGNISGLTLNTAAGSSGNSGAISIQTGGTSVSGTSGAITIDAGAGVTANGTITIGGTNASALTIGRSTVTTTVNGTLTANSLSSSGVTITGGSINGTTIGATTPSTGAFTTLSSTGATTLGNNSATVIIDGTNFDVSSLGIITLEGSQSPDITTGTANAHLQITANGSGNVLFLGDADTQFIVSGESAALGKDLMFIETTGATVISGVNALEIDFTTGDGTNPTNSGLQIDLVSGGTSAGDIIYGINLSMAAANASTQTAINIGANFDNGIVGTTFGANIFTFTNASLTSAGAATFASTTSPTYTGAGAVTVSSGGSSGLTFDSASGDITVAANDGLTFAATTLGNNGSRNVTINSGTGGTTATLIVKLDTSGTVVTTDTTTLNNAVGVALNTTTAGVAVRVAINGVVTATADNAVTAGDYIGLGTTTAGRAKSLGTTYPSTAGIQVIGRALGTQATPGSTFLLMLNGLDNNVAAGGGGGYNLIKDETTSLTARTTLAFLGTAVTCADNAGLTQTECTISGSGGGVSFASGTPDNTATANNLIHLQKSGANKFIVANNGGLSIFGSSANVVKTTTGTTNATDFSLTGSTLTNVTSQNDTITINEGTVPASGLGTMATSTTVTAAAAGAGSHTIMREDGQYIIIHGNSLATGSRWDGSATTMTSVTVATGAVNPGAGSIALKRPDGRYLVVHGNASAGLTSLFDPWGVTAIAAGPAVCGGGAATTGTNAFLRPDGKYVILCGNLTAWGVYDPTANTYTVGTAVATAFGAGAHAIQRDDGTFLVFRGGGFTSHWIYNPFASATGTMTADPIVTTPPTIATGAFSIRRNDGKFLVMGGAINTSSIYDPTQTSANSGAGSMTAQSGVGFGPTVALADGAQAVWRQDGKYLLIIGAASTVTNIVDPSVSTSSQFTGGPALPAAPGAGVHLILRPNGQYQIVRGGATTTTDNYDMGFIMGGDGTGTQLASYETECITTTSLNVSSRLFWNVNQEGTITFQAKTGTGACSGSYKNIPSSGDLIRPTAGDNRVQIKVFFKRAYPNFADQEWKIQRGLGQTRYRRNLLDPTLHDVSVDNSTQLHRTQFEFGNSSDPSGPVAINMTNDRDRNLAIALAMGVGYGSTINAGNPQFYNGAFGTHTALTTAAGAGTIVMRHPDGKFLIIAGNATANAQLYDPVLQTITAQSGAGNIPTAAAALGGLAVKRPDGKFLIVLGGATTTTNIYDPLAASGSRFIAGPALTAAAGRGAITIPLPNGRVLIMHGNFTSTSSIYDPIQNTMVAGPTPSAVVGGGSMAIPRPNGTFLFVPGIATEACTALSTVTNNFDPYTMVFTATGSPAMTTGGTGPGAFAFQRKDGQWVIMKGGATVTTCAGVNTSMVYNPLGNKIVAGPTASGVVQHGAHAIPRPDGTWLIVHAGALTTTSIYVEQAGAFTTDAGGQVGGGLAATTMLAGPALVTAAAAGSISFQRDDGKFVTITGNAGTVVQQYDGGWVANGLYRSEHVNIADLDSNSTLTWKATPTMGGISAEVRTATTQLGLQTTTAREVPTSGGLINPGGSETWLQINFNFKRSFPSYGGIYTDTWYNGGSPNQFRQRQIDTPTLTELKVNKDVNLVNLQSDGLSVFRVSSSGDIYTSATGSVNTGGADLAENYTSQVPLQKGEVVSIDPQNNHGVMRSKYQYQPDVLGVVSTNPGFVAGSHTKDSYPIALVGRVPVKVSTENGSIRVGDALTASSVPGYAMKASKGGRVIGKALETIDSATLIECPPSDFQIPGRKCGTVMVFVNLTDYLGAPVELVMAEKKSSDIGLEPVIATLPAVARNDENNKQEQILAFLKQLKDEQASSSAGIRSEIFTDRVTSQEIIGLNIFADTLHAKKIKADSIEGLEILTDKISGLSKQVTGLATQNQTASSSAVLASVAVQPDSSPQIASMSATPQSNNIVTLGNITIETAEVKLDLRVLGNLETQGGLIVGGPAEFKDNTIFNSLVQFISKVIFKGTVIFEGVPTFSSDTAGFAVIKKDADNVEVVFEKEYAAIPIVSLSMTFDPVKLADGNTEDPKILQKRISEQGYSYFVINRSTRGFTVVLNKPSSEDLTFSWIALAVKDPKITYSRGLQLLTATASATPITPSPSEELSSPPTNVNY